MAIFFHIDVNSAYLAWESLARLKMGLSDLRDVTAVVGGDEASRRGIVLSKSLSCKPFNIQTGESLMEARKKCPTLVVAPARYGVYEQYSEDMITWLHQFSDRVQQYSIDEAFIDYTHMERHFGSPLAAADTIRNGIRETFGFTVCVGIGPNKLLAKMATELRKPDFTNTLMADELEKMWVLPIEELFMAGRATSPKLRKLGIQTIGDLARFDVKLLEPTFHSFAHTLWQYANGIDDSKIEPHYAPTKSVGNSTTVPYDIKTAEDADRVLLHLCESVGKRLRQTHTAAKVLSVGIRNNDFVYYSHQRKMSIPTDNTTALYRLASQLFREVWKHEGVRQLGVRADKLCDSRIEQLTLFGQEEIDKQKKLDASIDAIRTRFGDASVMRASFLCKEDKRDHSLDKFSPFRQTGGL